MLGAYYNGPKFKCQPTSGTGWFSYKIWTKNSKTHMVNLLKNLRPFQNYILKIQWEIHFLTFSNTDQNAPKKKFRIEIWTFSFQVKVVKLKISKYVYLCIFSLTTSQSWKLIPKADLKWECPHFYSKFGALRSVFKKVKKKDLTLYFQILLGKWEGVILEIYYVLFRVFSPFLPKKSRQGG
jgi:hypothetical protein